MALIAETVYWAAEGDSRTIGSIPVGVTPFPTTVAALEPKITLNNVAVGGSKLRSVDFPGQPGFTLEGRASGVDALIASHPGFQNYVLTVWIGANDFVYGSNSGATTMTNYLAALSAYCDARRAAGWKLILCAETAAYHSGGVQEPNYTDWQTFRPALNTAMASWVGLHVDQVCDFEHNTILGPQAAADNSLYFNQGNLPGDDSVHPSQYGQSLLVSTMRHAISSIISIGNNLTTETTNDPLIDNFGSNLDDYFTPDTVPPPPDAQVPLTLALRLMLHS